MVYEGTLERVPPTMSIESFCASAGYVLVVSEEETLMLSNDKKVKLEGWEGKKVKIEGKIIDKPIKESQKKGAYPISIDACTVLEIEKVYE
ncbi:MAG: hypothetical protein EAZ55_04185 [Cytophagales bacterium]|nr:MAG: hypothetical protein EAZ55_04185 [Cytophagales bacterium]